MPAAKKTTAKKAPAKTTANPVDEQGELRDSKGRFVKGHKPTAGFHTHPENRNDGRWDSSQSISFWYNKFLAMTDAEIKTWLDKTPASERTKAQRIAYSRVKDASKENTRLALDNTREIVDRTEGKAPQVVTNITRRSPLDDKDFTKEELMAIAFSASKYTPHEINYEADDAEGSQNADETSEDAED